MANGYPHGRCKSKSKTTGNQCLQPVISGREVCYFHGGNTPNGFDLPQTKHGRYSKHLPTRLAGKYLEAQADPNLLNLRSEIALVDARTAELIQQVDTGESGRIWHAVRDTYKELNLAIQTNDSSWMLKCLTTLDSLISAGTRDYAVWREISANIEQRRKLVESERKRLVEMQQMITSERAMLLIAAVVDIVRENVDDTKVLRAISADVGKLITVDAS